MKKQTLWLLLIGNLSMASTLFLSPFFKVPEDIGDFFKGFGITLIISCLFVERKLRKTN